MNRIKTDSEIIAIKESGRMLATVLGVLVAALKPGMTTKEIDQIASKELTALGGKPAFLGFEGFPATICISVNEEVVHGIPGPRILSVGDLVGLDYGVTYRGMITDGAVTAPIGEASPAARRLLVATEDALRLGVAQVRDGVRVGNISHAIETRLRRDRLGVIEDLSGHGVGDEVHEEPLIMNFGKPGRGKMLSAGMTIAIEPMATLGTKEVVFGRDGWTVSTADNSLGAQFEHTVLVTNDGYEILTKI